MARRWPLALLSACALCACTYDFDAAFELTDDNGQGAAGATTSTGGTSTGGSTSGGTGGTAASGGVGGGGGQGAQGAGENCVNGTDDDDDQLVDCEDPDCNAFSCAEAPPQDWTGPVAFAISLLAQPLPGCDAGYPTAVDGNASLDAPAASCDSCTCGSVSVQCSLANTKVWSGTSCQGNLQVTLMPPGNGTCSTFSANDADTFEGEETIPTATCTPSGGGATLPQVSWDEHARTCDGASLGAGCGGGLCAPNPSSDFTLCIVQAGDLACPGAYSAKTVLYDTFSDSRSCTSCGCGPGNNADCTGSTEVWDLSSNCSGQPEEIVVNNGMSCEHPHMNAVNNGSFKFTVQGSSGPCPPTGGQPDGTVTPTTPTTVCCLP